MANGAAFGGFMSGMLGGASMASNFDKAMPTMKSPATDNPAAGQTPGFGLGQPLVSGEAGSAQIAGQQDSGWASLKKIVASLEPSTQPAAQKTLSPLTANQEVPNG